MNGQDNQKQAEYVATGIAVGAGSGVALGLVLMNILDQPGLFALGIAIGVTIGVAVSLGLARRADK